MDYLGTLPTTSNRVAKYSELSTPSDMTPVSNSTANSSYPTGAYAFNATTALSYPTDGRLTGAKNGTLNVQRLQDWANGSTYARYWINGTPAWSAWSIYLDAQDFTAKGQTHFASANNTAGVLAVGSDTQVLTADSTQSLGVKWAAAGGGGGTTWTVITGTTSSLATSNGYIANNASLVTFTLPVTAAVGEDYLIVGKGAGGWRLSQNASQNIYFGNINTTTGTGGYLASSYQRDTIRVICTVANTEFQVIFSGGNITYV